MEGKYQHVESNETNKNKRRVRKETERNPLIVETCNQWTIFLFPIHIYIRRLDAGGGWVLSDNIFFFFFFFSPSWSLSSVTNQ